MDINKLLIDIHSNHAKMMEQIDNIEGYAKKGFFTN